MNAEVMAKCYRGPKMVREYVDIAIDSAGELQQLVVELVLKLKQLYYNRKVKQPKAGRKQKVLNKKRYLVGLREVYKHVKSGDVKMVIMAVDLEKVEEENGTDEMVQNMIKTCKRMGVPLIYSMTKKQLGCLAKKAFQKASAIGIQNF